MEINKLIFFLYRYLLYQMILLISIIILSIYIPSNTFQLSSSNLNDLLVKIFPQGWAFFTKNPQEESFDYYIYEKGLIKKFDLIKNRFDDYLGFKREKREFISKLVSTVSGIDKNKWIKINQNKILITNISSDDNIFVIKNDILNSICNKKIIFIKKKPIPWTWRNLKNSSLVKYIVVSYKCN